MERDEVEAVLRRVEIGLENEPTVSVGFWIETKRRMTTCRRPEITFEAFGESWRVLSHAVTALTCAVTAREIAARRGLPGAKHLSSARTSVAEAARLILPIVRAEYAAWKAVAPAVNAKAEVA